MNHMQRIQAALRGEPVDRVPFSAYIHSTVHDRGVRAFADFTLDFHRRYQPDYVKVMYDENYDTPVNFQFASGPEVWGFLEELDPHRGGFGRQLESLKIIKDAVGPDTPVIQTLYAPFHWGVRLAWHGILGHWEQEPERVERGLGVIARNLAAFARCALEEAGIDGIMLGAYGCEPDWMSPETYRRLAMPHDRTVLAALRPGAIRMLHVHGARESYFDLLRDYDVDALSWDDRASGPSLAEARKRTGKCLMGGINQVRARTADPEQIVAEALDAIRQTSGRGLILAPGCTFESDTPEANLKALRDAVERAGKVG